MIKAAFKQSIRRLTPYHNFILGISLGSQNHRGAALEAIVDCINQSPLKQGVIDLSDTLRRHTYMIEGMDPEAAYAAAREAGNEWLRNNGATLEKLQKPYEIIRWDHWLQNERFPAYLEAFERAYETNPHLRAAVARDIQRFYTRKFNDAAQQMNEINLSVKFILEELAVMSIQFEDNPRAQLYPGNELHSLRVIRDGLVTDVPLNIQTKSAFFRLNVYEDPNAPQRAVG